MLHCHLVFVTKYRKEVFEKKHLKFLKNIFSEICNDFEASLMEFNGEANHVHLLVNYPPKIAISKLVNSLKGVSSRMLRKEFKDMHQNYFKDVLWSPSYFAGYVGGAPIETLKKNIENQKIPKSKNLNSSNKCDFF